MPKNMQNDVRTLAYVLRRTNYGEADRILNLITPNGKMSVMAKGVRKPKSKLAGGVEMFTLADLNIHFGKGEMGTLTGAKMLKYYGRLTTDLRLMELAALILKQVGRASESSDNPEYFTITDQSLAALNNGANEALVESWFWLNLAKAEGEEVNLYRDVHGEVLRAEVRYGWDAREMALSPHATGEVGAAEIKLMRLMLATEFAVIQRVKDAEKLARTILPIARAVNKV